jgi:hypothetical protein
MNGARTHLFALLLASMAACHANRIENPQKRDDSTNEAKQDPPDEHRVTESNSLPQQARERAEESLYARLLSAEVVAIFCDNKGLYAIGATGLEYVLDEPCDWLTIDFGSGVLWFERAWSRTHEPGLFMVNLAAAAPVAIKFTHIQRGFEIWDSQGTPLPMTEGDRPYRISMQDSPVTLTAEQSKYFQCGPECVLSEQAQAVGEVARAQYGAWNSPLPTLTMLAPTSGAGSKPGKTIAFPPASFELELRGVRLPDHPKDPYVWQLFDLRTSDYIGSTLTIRSKRPLPEGLELHHLMVCEDGYLIVEWSIYDSSLGRLEHQPMDSSKGVCLTGGALFDARWLLARSSE